MCIVIIFSETAFHYGHRGITLITIKMLIIIVIAIKANAAAAAAAAASLPLPRVHVYLSYMCVYIIYYIRISILCAYVGIR